MSLFSKKTQDNLPPLSESPDHQRWEALLRGQIIAATTHKFFNYINLADQKAQGLIILNSILIPVALNWVVNEKFHIGALICIITAVASIFAAIICIYPKRRKGRKPDGTFNLLHFGDVGRMSEPEYIEEFLPVFNQPSKLAEAAVKDLHDVSRRIIIPKFYWLKLSYAIFFFGNLIAISSVLLSLLI